MSDGSGMQYVKEWAAMFKNPMMWLNIAALPINYFFVFIAFFGEEYGWRYYLQPVLQKRFGLRAVEIEADAILLAKAVDGIYDSDPKVNPDAVKYDEISIQEVVDKKLAAMDLTASIMCLEQKMPMMVFALDEENSIINTVHGKFSGTKVTV